MATIWYKQNALPRLLRRFTAESTSSSSSSVSHSNQITKAIEVWTVPCIVQKFGKPFLMDSFDNSYHDDKNNNNNSAAAVVTLINPSNPSLVGVRKFSYFPRGGPQPTQQPTKDPHHIMGYVTQWGGMSLKDGMMFPRNVVDGIVHEMGGWPLEYQIWKLPYVNNNSNDNDDNTATKNSGNEKCRVGQAVTTGPGGKGLAHHYDRIVYTVPPFYDHCQEYQETPESLLASCYQQSLKLSFEWNPQRNHAICIPLVGAGCRGFPMNTAIEVAAKESVRWMVAADTTMAAAAGAAAGKCPNTTEHRIAFGIPEEANADALIEAINCAIDEQKQQIEERAA